MVVNFWGRLIAELRHERNLTQRALADLAGLPRAVVRRIESGETPGTIDQIQSILEVMNHDIDAIFVPGLAAKTVVGRILARIEDPATSEDERRVLRSRIMLLVDASNCNLDGTP